MEKQTIIFHVQSTNVSCDAVLIFGKVPTTASVFVLCAYRLNGASYTCKLSRGVLQWKADGYCIQAQWELASECVKLYILLFEIECSHQSMCSTFLWSSFYL